MVAQNDLWITSEHLLDKSLTEKTKILLTHLTLHLFDITWRDLKHLPLTTTSPLRLNKHDDKTRLWLGNVTLLHLIKTHSTLNTQLQTLNKNNWNLQLLLDLTWYLWTEMTVTWLLWTEMTYDLWSTAIKTNNTTDNVVTTTLHRSQLRDCFTEIYFLLETLIQVWLLIILINSIKIQPLKIFPPFKLELCIKTSSKCIKCMYGLYLSNENIFKSSKSWQTFIQRGDY